MGVLLYPKMNETGCIEQRVFLRDTTLVCGIPSPSAFLALCYIEPYIVQGTFLESQWIDLDLPNWAELFFPFLVKY